MTISAFGECTEWNSAHQEKSSEIPYETKPIRIIRQAYSGLRKKNSSPNTFNEAEPLRRMHRMKLSAVEECAEWN